MAIKKNTDKNLNIIKKDGITEPYEKEGFFKVKPEITEVNNVKIAQALDQDTINNIQSDANPDLIPPDELQINETGLPAEENIIQPAENVTNNTETQLISPETFEGSPNAGFPQQETTLDSNNLVEEISQTIDGPIEETFDGSPEQGIESLDQATTESNEESIEIPPQETEVLNVTEENNSEVIDDQLEIGETESQEIGPEEVVLDSNPSEGVSDQTNFVEAGDDSIGPEISELAGSPLEEVGDEIDVADTTLEQQDFAEAPDLEQINGGPQQIFSDADQVDIAQNNIAPTESLSTGNPLQTNEEIILDQDETVIETAEIGPEQSEVLGQPSQVITEDTESEIQFAEIAPELTDMQGSPQEEAVNVEESFQLAEAEEIPPQEGTAQDYIENVFEEKLSEGLQKGLTSEEATIAAIEAGRDAVKESASSPEEINEFAENFNNNIIEEINSKIEKIENDIQKIKEKSIIDEATETEVAQAEEEAVPQEETAETEVAQAEEEAVPQEETAETEVAQAEEEAVPQEETAETEVAQAEEEAVPQEETAETEVAQAEEEAVPQEETAETEVAQAEEEAVPQEETAETEVAQAEEEAVPQEETAETEVAQAEEEAVPQEETAETEVAQAEEEAVPQEETAEPPTELAQADIFSQDINDQIGDQALDSIVSESTVSSDDSLEQIETLSSLSDEAEDLEVSETDEVPDEETEEISDEIEEVETQTQVASVDNLSLDNTIDLNSGNVDGFNLTSPLTGTSSLLVNAGSSGSSLLGGVSSLGSVSILSAAASMGVESLGSVEVLSVLGAENTTLLDTVALEESPTEEGEVIFNEPLQNEVQELDFDGDGISDNADTDDDNDGVLDTNDVFPFDSTESSDFDDDGVGDNADTDDDDDGVLDTVDVFPNDATESSDFDGDGTGDNADTDDDDDGVLDTVDVFPNDATESSDFDGDGTGDNADTDDDNDGVLDVNDAFPFDATNGVINPTIGDDNITAGEGPHEFLYDFDSNVGGEDTLSDSGTDSDDRIFFKNIPDNHTILVSRDTDNNSGFRIETFDTFNPLPTSTNNSINTIKTSYTANNVGIDKLYFSTEDTDYDSSDSFGYEDFATLGSTNVYDLVQVVTGSTSDDNYSETDFDNFTFSNYSNFKTTLLDGTDDHLPYNQANSYAQLYLTKEGNDTINTPSASDVVYIADLGSGDDTVSTMNQLEEGTFLDGGDGTNDFYYTGVDDDHFAWNSSNFDDAYKPTNAAILDAQGNANNITSVDSSYFRNFERIDSYSGNDTFYIGGNPGNFTMTGGSGEEDFNFDYAFTSNITANGGLDNDTFSINTSPDNTGILTISGNENDDNFNFNTNISSTVVAYGNDGNDIFTFNNANITGNVTVDGGSLSDTFKFENISSGSSLTINNFEEGSDSFEFSSAAFSGDMGHVLVFGHVDGNEFFPDSTQTFSNGVPSISLHAFDEFDTQVNDLLTTSLDYWYYDTTDGYLYYDHDSDQSMEDAVQITKVTDNLAPLTKEELNSSDITYDHGSTI